MRFSERKKVLVVTAFVFGAAWFFRTQEGSEGRYEESHNGGHSYELHSTDELKPQAIAQEMLMSSEFSKTDEENLLNEMLLSDSASVDDMLLADVEIEPEMVGRRDLPAEGAFSSVLVEDPAIVESNYVQYESSLLEIVEGSEDVTSLVFEYELSDGSQVRLRVQSFDQKSAGRGVLQGVVDSDKGGEFLLSYNGEAEAGYFHIHGEGEYRIRYVGSGYHQVAQIDPYLVPACGTPN